MDDNTTKIAVIGLAGRFPGADSVSALWTQVLRTGSSTITQFEHENGGSTGFGVLDNPALFDNEFFDMSPAEARTVTPEHRIFLECVWAALENAGIDITSFDGQACVYGSASNHSASYLKRLVDTVSKEQLVGGFDVLIGNAMDSIATRVGYKLGLKGECISVQTHCSSSLTAVHLACQSLLSGQSDIAIAGGVSVRGSVEADREAELSQSVAQEGFILSRDGKCLALLDGATGTLPGDGVGVVVLKMLEDAIEDGDYVYAVIAGSGINNDGRRKVGFTAPSVDGVTDAISDALAFADLSPEQIDYLECHGTGTDLGDAIELRALRKVFESDSRSEDKPLYVGSIKSSIGHLAAGSGVSSLIKAIMAVHQGEIPALAHSADHEPHSEIRNSKTLAIPREPIPWAPSDGGARRAGVSSLGIGGTNVHIVVEEAPARETTSSDDARNHLLVWSARTERSLDASTRNLEFSLNTARPRLADVAATLRRGRATFDRRRCLTATDTTEAIEKLAAGRFQQLPDAFAQTETRKTVFMFPGSGAYRPDMVGDLLDELPDLRETLREFGATLASRHGFDLYDFLTSPPDGEAPLQHQQTAVVALEVALARHLIDRGVRPDMLIGSSLGEYAAACVSGALDPSDLLHLVYRRGELMEKLTGGAMALVNTSMSRMQEIGLADGVEEAIRVSEDEVAISGPRGAIEESIAKLEEAGLVARLLPPKIAYHSAALDPMEDEFKEVVSSMKFRSIDIPYVSNRTGEFVDEATIRDPDYWFGQLRRTVDLRAGFATLGDAGARLFFEVGPGQGMTKFVGMNFPDREDVVRRPCLSHPRSEQSDSSALLDAIGTGWLAGHDLEWDAVSPEGQKIPLPSYSFEGRYFYLGEPIGALPDGGATESRRREGSEGPRNELEELIAACWTDVLGVEGIGIDENFFDLGGDSLQATRVLSRFQAEISPEIGVDDIMQYRTIRELGEVLSGFVNAADAAGSGDDDDDSGQYYCAFELDFGGVTTTVHMTREDFDEQGVPEGAKNVRIL